MNGAYTSMCGTSAAAPQVAGAAALALSYKPVPHARTAGTAARGERRREPSGAPRDAERTQHHVLRRNLHRLRPDRRLRAAAVGIATELGPACQTLSGTAQVGQTLTGTDGGFSGGPPITLTHAWLRCDGSGGACAAIVGATAGTYTLVAADLGTTLRFQTTATNAYGSLSVNSAQSAAIAPPGDTHPERAAADLAGDGRRRRNVQCRPCGRVLLHRDDRQLQLRLVTLRRRRQRVRNRSRGEHGELPADGRRRGLHDQGADHGDQHLRLGGDRLGPERGRRPTAPGARAERPGVHLAGDGRRRLQPERRASRAPPTSPAWWRATATAGCAATQPAAPAPRSSRRRQRATR